MSKEERVSDVINQAALVFCIQVPTFEASAAIQITRKSGFDSGSQEENARLKNLVFIGRFEWNSCKVSWRSASLVFARRDLNRRGVSNRRESQHRRPGPKERAAGEWSQIVSEPCGIPADCLGLFEGNDKTGNRRVARSCFGLARTTADEAILRVRNVLGILTQRCRPVGLHSRLGFLL